MALRIKTASVIGAGTMGAQVAAHLANAGVGTLLLDVTRETARQYSYLLTGPADNTLQSFYRSNRRIQSSVTSALFVAAASLSANARMGVALPRGVSGW